MFKRIIVFVGMSLVISCANFKSVVDLSFLKSDKRLDYKIGIIQYENDWYYIVPGKVAEKVAYIETVPPLYSKSSNVNDIVKYIIYKNNLKSPLLESSSSYITYVVSNLSNTYLFDNYRWITNNVRGDYIFIYEILK